MSRSSVWQRVVSDKVSWQQDKANSSTIYILREVGPTSYLLKEDGVSNKFQVSLGDPHTCTCTYFQKEQLPCKHICWIFLKKFKLNRFNELSFQHGLVEREINILLNNLTICNVSVNEGDSTGTSLNEISLPEKKELMQRVISNDDVCPICQEKFLVKHQPVTFCRYGCGNSVHIHCMKVWVDHQNQAAKNEIIVCPFCRQEFADIKVLKQEFLTVKQEAIIERLDQHRGFLCKNCQMNPIRGKCYKCLTCKNFYLCNRCFHSNCHSHHHFVFRLRAVQQWKKVKYSTNNSNFGTLNISLDDLQNREITEADYDLLLQLDKPFENSSKIVVDLAGLPEYVIRSLPLFKLKTTSRLLKPGHQCRICLRCYSVGEFVRRLPDCGHSFHQFCLDEWLKNDHRHCPIDHIPVVMHKKKSEPPAQDIKNKNQNDHESKTLCLPGIGICLDEGSSLRQEQKRLVEAQCKDSLYFPNNKVDRENDWNSTLPPQQLLITGGNLSNLSLPYLRSRCAHSQKRKKTERKRNKENPVLDISLLALQGTQCVNLLDDS